MNIVLIKIIIQLQIGLEMVLFSKRILVCYFLPKMVAIRSTMYNNCIFFPRKSIVIGPFMSKKIISLTFFTDCYTQNFFFTKEGVCFYSIDCLFGSGSQWQTHF